jgi:hypothetical protein
MPPVNNQLPTRYKVNEMAKKNELTYVVKIFNDRGIRRLDGDIIAMSDGVLTLRFKKAKSKNYAMRTMSMLDVVGWSGGLNKSSTVFFRDRVVAATFKGQVEADKNGYLKVTDEDGVITSVLASSCECLAEKDVDAPPDSIRAKKKKVGTKAKSTSQVKKSAVEKKSAVIQK